MNLLSTAQAAERLGVSERRVRAMITAGKLRASLVGGTYVIRPSDLDKLPAVRKPGRPRKASNVRKAA